MTNFSISFMYQLYVQYGMGLVYIEAQTDYTSYAPRFKVDWRTFAANIF